MPRLPSGIDPLSITGTSKAKNRITHPALTFLQSCWFFCTPRFLTRGYHGSSHNINSFENIHEDSELGTPPNSTAILENDACLLAKGIFNSIVSWHRESIWQRMENINSNWRWINRAYFVVYLDLSRLTFRREDFVWEFVPRFLMCVLQWKRK